MCLQAGIKYRPNRRFHWAAVPAGYTIDIEHVFLILFLNVFIEAHKRVYMFFLNFKMYVFYKYNSQVIYRQRQTRITSWTKVRQNVHAA